MDFENGRVGIGLHKRAWPFEFSVVGAQHQRVCQQVTAGRKTDPAPWIFRDGVLHGRKIGDGNALGRSGRQSEGQKQIQRQPKNGLGDRLPPKLDAWLKRIEALPYYAKTIPPHWKG